MPEVTLPQLLASLKECVSRKVFEEEAIRKGLAETTLKRLKQYARKLGVQIRYINGEEWLCPPKRATPLVEVTEHPLQSLKSLAFQAALSAADVCFEELFDIQFEDSSPYFCFLCVKEGEWVVECVKLRLSRSRKLESEEAIESSARAN